MILSLESCCSFGFLLCWVNCDSLMHADLYRAHLLSSELDSDCRLAPACLVTSLWCTHCLGVRICPDSKHTVQQQKTFHIRIFESKCSRVLRCVFLMREVCQCARVHHRLTTHKVITMHCHPHSSFELWTVCASSKSSQFSTDQVHVV